MSGLPALLFLQDGIPEQFLGSLAVSAELRDWLAAEVNSDEVELVSQAGLDRLVRSGNSIAAIFSESHNHGINGIQEYNSIQSRFFQTFQRSCVNIFTQSH